MVKDNVGDNVDVSKLPVLNVGMVGHIDHGKTTLLQALSGKFADQHSEELKRGITIKLGYADVIIRKNKNDYNIEDGEPVRYITFIDVPGHEMLMATMLSGSAMIDVAILVVASNEGIKSQTREHLIALEAKKIKNIIIVQNKIDLVSKEEAVKKYKEIKTFIKGTVAENAVIIPVSALQKININKIYECLADIKIPDRTNSGDPFFIVARSFDVNRPGTKINELNGGVLGGALKQGTLKIGDEIEIKPGMVIKEKDRVKYETVKTKIISLYRGSHAISEAIPGGSLSIETSLDMFFTKSDKLSGCVAGLAGKVPEISYSLKVKATHFKEVFGLEGHVGVEDFRPGETLMLSVNTSVTIGKVIRVKDGVIEFQLNIPVVPFSGDNVGIARNINGHWRLVGFGEIA
ncbi:translation initiation factor IF-2 subunit gamma [Candidatus Pacearchaeota archaeon CG10_big_fil_rev_8_21_14_0_10_31_9]|nr:MAG: translation initiation factor IF-2 subunit gamma [Candidatus Pacearchaeota archaeon CG1_02_32_21]PIN91891.1 MAG: translation initiation factor IF-2 subunit gamma [Candidatus Pacearchaeota archaeon CG10_big_fil_rev_8_21_14_0_10_31_9]PIZ82709.1 MAG: translation initiation factor IF-2 subunit gamma [Candidatus Pacearchaeota archaeon CG_4_10_14_0_2_um_filter_05_32_18]